MKEIKVAVIGVEGTGKSALTLMFITGQYIDKYDPSIEDIFRKNVVIDNEKVTLEITDTASLDPFPHSYIKKSQGLIIVYSVWDKATFNDISDLKERICFIKKTTDVPIVLVGNKCDLKDRQVSRFQGTSLAVLWKCSFYETSAKTNHNVDEVFMNIARQILLKDPKVAAAKKKDHKEAYQKAITEKLSLNVRPAHFNHIGISRSGKTSFQRRMMGEILNLLAAMKAGEEFQPSTGVAEVGGQVFIRSLSTGLGTIQSRVWATVKDVKEEASMLNQCIYQAVSDTTTSASMMTSNTGTTDVSEPPTVPRSSAPKKSTWKKFASLFDRGAKAPSKKDLEETFSVIGEVMENARWDEIKYLLDDIILLINTDTGGQAEFLDLQASLVLGPSLNFLYSRLIDDLDKQFETYYTNEKGVSTKKHSSTNTVEDVLFQALASIACLGGYSLQSEGDKKAGTSQSKAIFIGTHLDLVTPEELKKKDEILQRKVKNTEFYSRKIVEFASEDQMMIAVDNMKGDEKEIEKIRTLLEQIILRNFDKIAIPAAWLMLSLCIRNTGVRTMSIRECQELAAKLRIAPSELQDALWFLHHHIGVLLYYPEIESLKDTVICDLQVVFDSASNLIKNTFTFELVGHQRSLAFREKGQFTLNDLNKAVSGCTDDLLSFEKLVDLLKDRNVLTIMPSSVSSPTTEGPTYFMPCVLNSASPEELLAATTLSSSDSAPLMLRYDCGYFPIGVFPAMITNLVSQQREDWLMITEGLRKNRVQFRVGDDFDIVTLILHPRFLEIQISGKSDFEARTGPLCNQVRGIVQTTLVEVTSHLSYHFKMGYKFGFLCPIHSEQPRDHICVLAKTTARNMECPQDKAQPIPLQSQHKVWFTANSSIPQQCSKNATDTSTSTPSPNLSSPPVGEYAPPSSSIPSQRSLSILKWRDEQGKEKTFRLVDKVSAKWEGFGVLLGLEYNQLDALEREARGKVKECWNRVMDLWRHGCSQDYPATWEGLYCLLRDMEYGQIATELEEAVKNPL